LDSIKDFGGEPGKTCCFLDSGLEVGSLPSNFPGCDSLLVLLLKNRRILRFRLLDGSSWARSFGRAIWLIAYVEEAAEVPRRVVQWDQDGALAGSAAGGHQ